MTGVQGSKTYNQCKARNNITYAKLGEILVTIAQSGKHVAAGIVFEPASDWSKTGRSLHP